MSAVLTGSHSNESPPVAGKLAVAAGLRSASHVVSRWEMERISSDSSVPGQTRLDGEKSDTSAQAFPRVGETFLGFKLISLLGTGGFGKVYLAQQENLADRPVALKVTATRNREPQRLARLQHPNIMPIHSVHYSQPFQVVCMPCLGTSTLHNVAEQAFKGRVAPASGSTIFDTERDVRGALSAGDPTIAACLDAGQGPQLPAFTLRQELSQLGYVEAILSILSRLCEGLDHAHRAGVIHRDLKPANILISSDGQPMLLDFNLAIDTRTADPVERGGTIPYMAPEQLRILMAHGSSPLTPACDLYSLGIIAYELLCGTSPFPVLYRDGTRQFDLKRMDDDRRIAPVCASGHNPAVPASVDAILQKMLAYRIGDRYANALELRDDISRQLSHRSLRFAREPALDIHLRKWQRRHPRLLPAAVAGALLFAALIAAFAYDRTRWATETLRANQTFAEALVSLDRARLQMHHPDREEMRERGMAAARGVIDQYGASSNPEWHRDRAVALLNPADRRLLRDRVAEALLQMAARERARGTPDALERALEWNRWAGESFATGMPEYGERQRLELLRKLDRPEAAGVAVEAKQPSEKADPANALLKALDYRDRRQYDDAIRELKIFADANPQRADGHLLLAECYRALHRDELALERLNLAGALDAANPRISYTRAQIYLDRGRHAAANQELNQALQIDSERGWGHILKSRYYIGIQRPDDALRSLDAAVEEGYSKAETAFIRVAILEKFNRREEARKLRERIEDFPLRTASEYVLRGNARLATDPDAALADYQTAAKLNPHMAEAYNNQACVYSEHGRDLPAAIAAMKKALELAPGFSTFQASLAVLLARDGQREASHRYADEAIRATQRGDLYFQAASVYSLTSRQAPADADVALRHLSRAITLGYLETDTVRKDADLEHIRNHPGYKIVEQTMALMQSWSRK